MRTKDRILDASLRLFNEQGVSRVSTNRIATELDISPGNLYYHFKSKQQIVDWLFRRFEQRFIPLINSAEPIRALDDWWLTVHLLLEAVYEYRFVYREIDYLVREFPAVAIRARRLTLHSLHGTRRQCGELADAGILRASAEDLELLALHIVFTGTCWLSFATLLPEHPTAQPPSGLAAYHVFSLLGPYLAEGPRQYLNYLRSKYLK